MLNAKQQTMKMPKPKSEKFVRSSASIARVPKYIAFLLLQTIIALHLSSASSSTTPKSPLQLNRAQTNCKTQHTLASLFGPIELKPNQSNLPSSTQSEKPPTLNLAIESSRPFFGLSAAPAFDASTSHNPPLASLITSYYQSHNRPVTYRRLSTALAINNDQLLAASNLNPLAATFMSSNSSITARHLPSLMVTNARSICNKVDYLCQILDDLEAHIVVLSETWITKANRDLIVSRISTDTAYNIASAERSHKNGGGVMILMSSSYVDSIKVEPPTPPITRNWQSEEGRLEHCGQLEVIIVHAKPVCLPRGYSCVLVAAVYIPEWTLARQRSSIGQLLHALEDPVTKYSGTNVPLIFVCGDFNGCNVKPLCDKYHLRQINHDATRGTRCLDIVLTNAPECYISSTRAPLGPPRPNANQDLTHDTGPIEEFEATSSDHEIVVATAPLHLYKSTRPTQRKIMMRSGHIRDTVEAIRQLDMNTILANIHTSPHSTITAFQTALLNAQNTCQPLRMLKAKGDKQWMTRDIKTFIEQRQRFHKAGLHDQRDILAHHISKLVTARKVAYYRTKYAISKTSMWSHANSLRTPPVRLTSNTNLGESLNEQFADTVWHGINKPDLTPFIKHNASPNFTIFTFGNVAEQLLKLKSTAAGPDGVSGKLLYAARLEIVEPLVNILNHCVSHSIVPDEWLLGNITPIPKVQNPATPKDYRPISITSTVCKIAERILTKYILSIMKHKLLSNKQFGFLPGRCTSDAIIQVVDEWGQAIDRHEPLTAIFFDFSTAFDLVDHVILLNKLQTMLPAWLTSWIASWLNGRKQRVIIDSPTQWKNIVAGVIQGSVLGPTLFLLFILDVEDYLPTGVQHLKYADDILAFIRGDEVIGLPQAVIDGLQHWCEENKMRLNVAKCKIVRIGRALTTPITLLNQQLEIVASYKYLGIDLNAKLDFTDQWHRVRANVAPAEYLLRQLRIFGGWSSPMLAAAYNAYCVSHFTYSAIVLTSTTDKIKNEMTVFQNRLLRAAGLESAESRVKFNLPSINDHIESICTRTLLRILSDKAHPITAAMPKSNFEYATFPYNTRFARHPLYYNTFLQKFTRQLRNNANKQP